MGRKSYITVWISSLKNIEEERKSQLLTDSKYTSGIRDLSLTLETRAIIKILCTSKAVKIFLNELME